MKRIKWVFYTNKLSINVGHLSGRFNVRVTLPVTNLRHKNLGAVLDGKPLLSTLFDIAHITELLKILIPNSTTHLVAVKAEGGAVLHIHQANPTETESITLTLKGTASAGMADEAQDNSDVIYEKNFAYALDTTNHSCMVTFEKGVFLQNMIQLVRRSQSKVVFMTVERRNGKFNLSLWISSLPSQCLSNPECVVSIEDNKTNSKIGEVNFKRAGELIRHPYNLESLSLCSKFFDKMSNLKLHVLENGMMFLSGESSGETLEVLIPRMQEDGGDLEEVEVMDDHDEDEEEYNSQENNEDNDGEHVDDYVEKHRRTKKTSLWSVQSRGEFDDEYD